MQNLMNRRWLLASYPEEQRNGDCPRRAAPSLHERCDLVCPDLPKVL
jgi:hypothetical protein